jgi:ribosomal protein S18 acetylase RimI-like enzyme
MAAIRSARDSDAETLSALGGGTFTQTFGHMYRPEDLAAFLAKSHSRDAYARLLADPGYALWIAEEEGAPAGYCVAGPCSLPVPDMPENAGELARLYLYRDYHSAGLGGRMLALALDWLRARFEHVYLSVYAENFGAQRLYARHGFEKVCDYFYMVGEQADPEWIMKLRA